MINQLSPYFQEAETKMLAVMLSIVEDFPDYQFVIAGAQVRSFLFMKVL
jgi:lipid-A-disaccharide synthase